MTLSMSSIVRLNVGGTVFITQTDTLVKRSAYFAAMFNGKMRPGD